MSGRHYSLRLRAVRPSRLRSFVRTDLRYLMNGSNINRIVNLASGVAYAGGRTGADRLRTGVGGAGGGEQAKIVMARQGRGLRGRTDGRAGKAIPPHSGVTACFDKAKTGMEHSLVPTDEWPDRFWQWRRKKFVGYVRRPIIRKTFCGLCPHFIRWSP